MGKANVVADALSRKERIKPSWVRTLVMTIGLDLPKQILEARTEARKPENITTEDIPEIIHETTEKIVQIKQRIQADHDFQKSYAEVRHKPLEFQEGNKVMLRVSPWKGVIHFGKQGKLHPRYIRPFKVLAKVGTVAYRLKLPQQQCRVHSMFHVSNLKKCLSDEPLAISLDEIHTDDKIHFVEQPMEIMDREVKRLKQSRILIVKVRWNSNKGPEFTWKHEDKFRKNKSSNNEEDIEDDGSQSEDKLTADNDVDTVSESSCMHNNDLLYDNNHKNIKPNKDKVLSNDPFNIYDILNKRKDSGNDLKYPFGFIPSVINMEEVSKKVKGATSNEELSIDYGLTPFRFFYSWFNLNGYEKMLEDTWKSLTTVDSNGMINLKKKLQALKIIITQWTKNAKKSSHRAKISIESKLSDIDKILAKGRLRNLKFIGGIEGDENTKFFHEILNSKRSQLAIYGTLIDG
uniref:Putative reverse transcriptase domain-containing protein n=1 Tax=Tanacetum cinerariifolium TaxID=118510 RepID=A0A699GTX1_TANCI|nr:putative reverse transcriptase domain-containing protein [Tanacetum cinerariifolium]